MEEYYEIKPDDYPLCANNPCSVENLQNGYLKIQTCKEKCPLQCDRTIYEHSTSSSDYPKRIYAELLYNHTFINEKYDQFDYEKIKGDVVSFNIFYSDLKTTKILQVEKFGILDFIAAGGGFLGNFLNEKTMNINYLILFINLIQY